MAANPTKRESQLTRLDKEVEALKSAGDRMETFGSAAFVLTLTLIRELIIEGVLPRERAVRMVKASISTLRKLYHVDHPDPFADDSIDFDQLFSTHEEDRHERHAEELLRTLLDSLRRRGG